MSIFFKKIQHPIKSCAFLNFASPSIKKLHRYLWPRDSSIRLRFLIAGLLLLATIALNVSVPLILRQVINELTTPHSPLFFIKLLLLSYGVIWTSARMVEQLRLVAMNRVVERGIRLLTLHAFERMMKLSLRFHTDKKTGAIINAIDRAQYAFPGLVWGLFLFVIPTLIEIAAAAIMLVYLYGLTYGLLLALIFAVFIYFTIKATNWSVNTLRVGNEKSAEAIAKLVDSITNYEAIRSNCREEFEYKRCDQYLLERENAMTKQHATVELVMLGQGVIIGLGLILFTWLSGTSILSGKLVIGDFVLLNAYLLQFMGPLGNFGHLFRDVNQGLTNLEDVLHIIDEKSEIEDSPDATPLELKKGSISFEQVSFAYDKRRPILQNITVEIPAKKTTAIVGASGSGKSTIANLLFRYYDPSSGNILIDGQNIRALTQHSLQAQIGIVSQNTALFNDTLRYNIVYGNPLATDTEIQRSILHAHLDTLIQSLPEGLDTMIGEHGLKLSGGEKQRVAIARVLLKKPAIFIFDEATSALDTKTERLIQENIEEISRHTTTLIIAHRLSTIVHADQILVLDQGQLVERGSHEELLQQKGVYAQLWNKQIHREDV